MGKLKGLLLLLISITMNAQDNKFNIIFSQDFDHHSAPVEYTFDLESPDFNNHGFFDSDHRWPDGWANNPNIKDSIVVDPISGSNVLKLCFDDAIIEGYDGQTSGRGGEGFLMDLGSEPKEVYLSYNMMVRPGFLPSGGGKFPGMAGAHWDYGQTPPADGEGFKADLMWHWPEGEEMDIGYYASYHGMPTTYGQYFPFRKYQPVGEGLQYHYKYPSPPDGPRFYLDVTNPTWYNITLRYVVNTFTGSTPNYDGLFEAYINGYLVGQVTGLYLITYPDKDEGVDELMFRCFFGGGGPPLRDEWVLFDDIVVFTYAEGVNVPRGNTLSPEGRVLDLPNLGKIKHVNSELPSMPMLPDISIIDVKNTPVPNIAITEAKISSFGQTEIHDYGLTITKSEELIANELLILATKDDSKILNAERASRGLKVLYVFDEGEGNQILDKSGIDPLVNLEIQNTSATSWLTGRGLRIEGNTIISTNEVPAELINSITSTNEITLEAWIKPADINQSGPARIISLSKDPFQRAFTLGQEGDQASYNYIVRLNTTSTDANGMPNVNTENNFNNLNLHHVVYTRKSNGEEKIFVNGQECYSGMRDGDFSSMGNDYYLSIANELTGDRPWNGTYYLLAIYNQALSTDEINMNFTAGLGEIRFTTNLLVEPNVTYLVTPFARSDKGVIYGNTEVLRPWSNVSSSPLEDNVEPYHGIDW